MGNRLDEGSCVICGGIVIEPNSWHTCSQCVKVLKEKVLKRVGNPGQARRVILPPVHKK
jgi:hypothetical protein